MVLINEIRKTLNSMILSASGWRGVFAIDGGEESRSAEISDAHKLITAAAANVFAGFLAEQKKDSLSKPIILVGTDTRPTGKAISGEIIRSALASGCTVKWAGSVAAPEIMAWAQQCGSMEKDGKPIGFIFISASHNPIGHNGLKFGLTDGGVLAPEQAALLLTNFNSLLAEPEFPSRLEKLLGTVDENLLAAVYSGEAEEKKAALDAYFNLINAAALDVPCAGASNEQIRSILKSGLKAKPLGLVCDFNGSSRSVSIDRKIYASLGIGFRAINEKAGEIAHRIVPEGESLIPCMQFLEETHCADSSFILGYTPDCDGDRGNLVIWDESKGQARILEAQEVFALACIAELSLLVRTGGLVYNSGGRAITRAALAVNDPTSLRIDRIAGAFDVSIFRAETGEANVVGLSRRLRENGYLVRILGEGSAGGNITHPQAVRDPLNTVLGLVKLLAVRSAANKPGLFELWCERSHQTALYHENFSLSDIIASLPPFITTGAYEKNAILKIKTADHNILKDRYQRIFLREWDERKEKLRSQYGMDTWEAAAYNGIQEKRGISNFADAGKGGLKICFYNRDGLAIASLWMRGSATEPVFRIMADAEGRDKQIEQYLIDWQRRMVQEADEE